jgi:hypothetical protein
LHLVVNLIHDFPHFTYCIVDVYHSILTTSTHVCWIINLFQVLILMNKIFLNLDWIFFFTKFYSLKSKISTFLKMIKLVSKLPRYSSIIKSCFIHFVKFLFMNHFHAFFLVYFSHSLFQIFSIVSIHFCLALLIYLPPKEALSYSLMFPCNFKYQIVVYLT